MLPPPQSQSRDFTKGGVSTLTTTAPTPCLQLLGRAQKIINLVRASLAYAVNLEDEDEPLIALSSGGEGYDSIKRDIQSAIANCQALSGDEIYRFVVSYLATESGGRMPSPVQVNRISRHYM